MYNVFKKPYEITKLLQKLTKPKQIYLICIIKIQIRFTFLNLYISIDNKNNYL